MTQTRPKKLPRWPRMAPGRLQSNFWILALGLPWTGGVSVAGWLAGWNPKSQQVAWKRNQTKCTDSAHSSDRQLTGLAAGWLVPWEDPRIILSPKRFWDAQGPLIIPVPFPNCSPERFWDVQGAPDHPKTFPELFPRKVLGCPGGPGSSQNLFKARWLADWLAGSTSGWLQDSFPTVFGMPKGPLTIPKPFLNCPPEWF